MRTLRLLSPKLGTDAFHISVPYVGAVFYACMTPLGVAIGLGIRNTFVLLFLLSSLSQTLVLTLTHFGSYNPDSAIASIVSGVLDALSSGILLYTGLVELLAHDFIFNRKMVDASNSEVAFSV